MPELTPMMSNLAIAAVGVLLYMLMWLTVRGTALPVRIAVRLGLAVVLLGPMLLIGWLAVAPPPAATTAGAPPPPASAPRSTTTTADEARRMAETERQGREAEARSATAAAAAAAEAAMRAAEESRLAEQAKAEANARARLEALRQQEAAARAEAERQARQQQGAARPAPELAVRPSAPGAGVPPPRPPEVAMVPPPSATAGRCRAGSGRQGSGSAHGADHQRAAATVDTAVRLAVRPGRSRRADAGAVGRRAGVLRHRSQPRGARRARGLRRRSCTAAGARPRPRHGAEDARGAECRASLGLPPAVHADRALSRARGCQAALHAEGGPVADARRVRRPGARAARHLAQLQGPRLRVRARLQQHVRRRAVPHRADRLRPEVRRCAVPLLLAVEGAARPAGLQLRPREHGPGRAAHEGVPGAGRRPDRREVRQHHRAQHGQPARDVGAARAEALGARAASRSRRSSWPRPTSTATRSSSWPRRSPASAAA